MDSPQHPFSPLPFSLVPDTPNTSPDYFFTWQAQLYLCNNTGPQGQRDCLTENALLGDGENPGFADLHPDSRKDLIFLLDDSWDVPIGGLPHQSLYYGSLLLAKDKFPSFIKEGVTNQQAMANLNQAIQKRGWRGVGGWICAQQAPLFAGEDPGKYWEDRLTWSENAGWLYWKIDWGTDMNNYAFRRMLVEMRYRFAPNVLIEQAMIPSLIPYSDAFRTYDVLAIMSIPCTLEKLAMCLNYQAAPGYLGLINCEDEVYIAAALGCAIGTSRHNIGTLLPNGQPDPSFPDLHRRLKTKIDEVTRALRWHRIAPAFSVNGQDTQIDTQLLQDSWQVNDYLAEVEAWWKYRNGDLIERAAPARIARSLPLPSVTPDQEGQIPYVVCAKHPNGAVSIATLGRTNKRQFKTPLCAITLDARLDDPSLVPYSGTFGIFGEYETLTILTNLATPEKRVYAQDLLSDTALDITDALLLKEGSLQLPGKLIHQIGTLCAHPEDTSEPGLMLKIM